MANQERVETTLAASGSTGWYGFVGSVRVAVTNDFGTGTATVEERLPDQTARAFTDGAFTAAADKLFDLPKDVTTYVRVTLASATDPDLDVTFQGKPAP